MKQGEGGGVKTTSHFKPLSIVMDIFLYESSCDLSLPFRGTVETNGMWVKDSV